MAEIKKTPWDRLIFMVLLTFVGGYMNAYTYVTRNKVFSNMHTSNMSKLGIFLARGEWENALFAFLPILFCILGVCIGEYIRKLSSKKNDGGDWRKTALLIEGLAFIVLGFVPLSVPDRIVTLSVSLLTGFQLSLFRQHAGTAHNTTICTGNIRNVGQLAFEAVDKGTPEAVDKFFRFSGLTFSFAVGSFVGALITDMLSIKSVWVCSIILIGEAAWMKKYNDDCGIRP